MHNNTPLLDPALKSSLDLQSSSVMMPKKLNHVFVFLLLSIIPFSAYPGNWFVVDGGVGEIDIVQYVVEDSLWQYIERESLAIFEPRENYTYQYQAIDDNRMKIFAMCHAADSANLNKSFLIIMDGGSCFFEVEYNYRTEKFSKFFINGEA